MKKIGIALVSVLVILSVVAASAKEKSPPKDSKPVATKETVTFVELGSVRCVPCKMMQPIMRQVETNYAGKVKVVFYDVWTPAGSPAAEKYRIKLIPTQVFLDASGKEFFRHEGFFAYDEIKKVLEEKGVKSVVNK